MQITIVGHHVEVTDALRDYVNDKMDHLKRLEDYVKSIHVTLSLENQQLQKASAKVTVTGNDLYAEAVEETMYASIDVLADKLERQLVKYKEKLTQ
ncbi:MAG: ribosome-associated translation inhibitor RaiA [Ruminobacter sp.]|jgi:putative sigma-54 modulation protein|nr:ribosome-associated translation inhibitor RaiA [Ruminobacter sp.]MBR1923831.1 ribosome-associated translation inhibitor RaiA [Ruminobacter sp.]